MTHLPFSSVQSSSAQFQPPSCYICVHAAFQIQAEPIEHSTGLQMTIPDMLHAEQHLMLIAFALVSAAGALREALLIGYDLPRMEGLWPSEKQCPGFKYAPPVYAEQQGTCTHVQ